MALLQTSTAGAAMAALFLHSAPARRPQSATDEKNCTSTSTISSGRCCFKSELLGSVGVKSSPFVSKRLGWNSNFSREGGERGLLWSKVGAGVVALQQPQQQGSHRRRDVLVQGVGATLTPVSDSPSQQNSMGDVTRVDFPILHQEISGNKLVYLDNAATSQKPSAVLNALKEYYEGYNSNVHRGIHFLSAKATDQYEVARSRVAKFINAPSHADVVFTRNASESINLVAYSWAQSNLRRGDEIVLSLAEHHSNLVPWQLIADRIGVVLKFASLTDDERVDVEELKRLITNRTKLVATYHVSNTLGAINPVEEIIEWAHKYGAKVLLDACQSVPHMPVDVQALDVDFLVASSHKMCGPTGVGFLYGKSEILQGMPPWMGGGEMIADVFLDHSTFAQPPSRFEAGTPAIGEAIGLGVAVDYLSKIGMDKIHAYEADLGKYLYEKLSAIPDLKIYGPPPGVNGTDRVALCAFNIEGIHPTDIATVLDMEKIKLRAALETLDEYRIEERLLHPFTLCEIGRKKNTGLQSVLDIIAHNLSIDN